MYTIQALQILIFLLPGFVSARILNALVVIKAKKEFEKVVEALIFSMLIYTIYFFISGRSPVTSSQIGETVSYSYNGVSFLLLGFLSLGIPLVFGLFITNDWHMKVARKLQISRRTARSSVWFDVFCDMRKHIIVNFENGRRVYGWPMYYSDNPDSQYIFLHNPAWIEKDRYVYLDEEGMLITPQQKIEFIEFLES